MDDLGTVEELVPHTGNMILLSRVLAHSDTTTRCLVEIGAQTLFRDANGEVDALVGIEYMAQCIAVHGGLAARARGVQPKVGFLLGTRRMTLNVDRLHSNQSLEVGVDQVWGQSTGMVSFNCWLRDLESQELLAEARLNCFLSPDDLIKRSP